MLQDPFLFAGTIADNIRFAKPDASDEDVERTAAAIGVDRVVARFEGGLDHHVREGGAGLSAGERQLISIARALLADPRILILDEATSNIDRPTEILIERALDRLLHGRTSVIIAHRLATVRRADEIVVVEHGRILQRGRKPSCWRGRPVPPLAQALADPSAESPKSWPDSGCPGAARPTAVEVEGHSASGSDEQKLFARDREDAVVFPDAVDAEVPLGVALLAEARLLEHAHRAGVPRDDRRLHPVQAHLVEGEADGLPHRLGRVAAAVHRLVDEVAEVGVAEHTAHDLVQRDPPHELRGEDAEREAAVGARPFDPRGDVRALRLERVPELVAHGLPGLEEHAVAHSQLEQRRRVRRLERPQGDQPSCHSSPRSSGTASPAAVSPSTSTSGPPIMKSVCTFASLIPSASSAAVSRPSAPSTHSGKPWP